MDREKCIQRIFATLGTGTDRIPLRRALRMSLTEVDELREGGLTWGQIALRLTKAGARHKRGQAISEHQLRTEYGRLIAERKATRPVDVRQSKVAPIPINEQSYSGQAQGGSTQSGRKTAGPHRLADILSTRARPVELDD